MEKITWKSGCTVGSDRRTVIYRDYLNSILCRAERTSWHWCMLMQKQNLRRLAGLWDLE